MNDLTFAFRQLMKNPGFTAVVVLMLALLPAFGQASRPTNQFLDSKAGDEISVEGIRLCWCPPGKFIMGSPPGESERRSGEDHVEVTLTKGVWMGKFEATQGQWKRVMGGLNKSSINYCGTLSLLLFSQHVSGSSSEHGCSLSPSLSLLGRSRGSGRFAQQRLG